MHKQQLIAKSAFASLFLAFTALSQAQITYFANVTLDDPHKVVAPGAGNVVFGGTIQILEDAPNGWIAQGFHLYLEGSNSFGTIIEQVDFAPEFYQWLGMGGTNLAGATYNGPMLTMFVDPTDQPGLYWHDYSGLNNPASYFLQSSQDPNIQSNRVAYSIEVVPEPATILGLSIAAAGIAARRKKRS